MKKEHQPKFAEQEIQMINKQKVSVLLIFQQMQPKQ